MLLGSPRTARALVNPDELPPDIEDSAATVLELTLEVSMCNPMFGDFDLTVISSSTQPAGVGGTGPRLDIGARLDEPPGRRVGGAVT
jgi:hypothetical protein